MRLLHRYSAVLLPLFFVAGMACGSYEAVVIDDKIVLPGGDTRYKFTGKSVKKRADAKTGKQDSLLVSSEKYFARGKGFTPESMIINGGVNEALKGNYIEAEILFKHAGENISDGSIENNLAVIYEITKRKKDAMTMYTRALVKSPDNLKFRSNLLSFINHNKFKNQ